jgi:hypothetical protein
MSYGTHIVPISNWSYAAASGGIVDTSDVALKAAVAGQRASLTSLQLVNADATVATEVVVKDGSTVIFRTWLPLHAAATTPDGIDIKFDPPLRGTANTALNIAAITTSAIVYANAQGFMSV